VALKLLPEAFAADPDRRARFERGAKVRRLSRARIALPRPRARASVFVW